MSDEMSQKTVIVNHDNPITTNVNNLIKPAASPLAGYHQLPEVRLMYYIYCKNKVKTK